MKEKIYVEITSREDERKWKEFLGTYFPNHYAKGILKEDLMVDVEGYRLGKPCISKRIGVSISGYGWLNAKCAYYGNYERVLNFEEFKNTDCYKNILSNGVYLGLGEPDVVGVYTLKKTA